MRNKLVLLLAATLPSVFGFAARAQNPESNDSLVDSTNSYEDAVSLDETLAAQSVLDVSVLYKNKGALLGAIEFLSDNDIPFSVQTINKGNTIISIMKKDEISLATQRWATAITNKTRNDR